jgi:putative ABC transport system substrate-binding protein
MRRREFIAGLGSVALLPSSAKPHVAAKHFRPPYLPLTPAENVGMMKVLVDRLRELGWVEGQNLTIDYRSAQVDAKRLANLAVQLVATKPDEHVIGR